MAKIFLSGPIRGISREDALGWRREAKTLLNAKIETIHALRGREVKETLPDPRIAIQRDKSDISNSDIVLVNDTNVNASMIGTSMEVLYAHQLGKLVVIFGNAHDKDYWLNYHSHVRFETLEQACDFIMRHYSD